MTGRPESRVGATNHTGNSSARDYYAHPTALVESSEIGPGTRIWAFCHVMSGCSVGADCNIGDHCYLESGVSLGDHVTVKNGVSIWDGVTIEDSVFIGPNATFTNDPRPRSKKRLQKWIATRIGEGATIGANATVLPGITVGEHAFVGAGAVVTRRVDPYSIVVGNPARFRGYICICARPLIFGHGASECQCGRRFTLSEGTVQICP